MKSRLLILFAFVVPTHLSAQLSTGPSWTGISNSERQKIFEFAEEYKSFIAKAKTELSFVREMVVLAEQNGFRAMPDQASWTPGSKYYDVNRDRTISLVVIGRKRLAEGVRLIGSHIDSPRLELKPRPLYQRYGFAMFQTNYHGGIKRYQWASLPLAIMGRIDKTDGSTVKVNVGNHLGEPVFIIPDLAPHVDRQYRGRTASEVLQGEEMDPIIGSISQNGSVEEQIMTLLRDKYKIDRADFISAELALVPALQPNDVGFDEGMIAAYGQDDRSCSYVAAKASMMIDNPQYTTIAFLVDNEESGSNNNTGANSDYLRGLLGRLLTFDMGDRASELYLRRILPKTYVLSADATTGVNPIFPGVQEHSNAAKLSQGVVIKLYGRGNSANSEFTAKFRGLLEKNNIPYQTHTYKVGVGGGGTIGNFMSRENMEVLDCGIPLLSMHSPYSISSKVDIWSLYRAFQAFYSEN